MMMLPGGVSGKESAANAEDARATVFSVPESKILWEEGNGNPPFGHD